MWGKKRRRGVELRPDLSHHNCYDVDCRYWLGWTRSHSAGENAMIPVPDQCQVCRPVKDDPEPTPAEWQITALKSALTMERQYAGKRFVYVEDLQALIRIIEGHGRPLLSHMRYPRQR